MATRKPARKTTRKNGRVNAPEYVDVATLEQLIDSRGLVQVLDYISVICYEKAGHIRESYGNGDATQWERAGAQVARMGAHPSILRVSP